MGQSTHGEPAATGAYAPGDEIAAKYRLVRSLGEGGMGAVWLARNLLLDIDVALKLIHRDLAMPDAPSLLLKEARTAALLGHRSIVRVFDFGVTERGDPYIVMEVLSGISLASMLARSTRSGSAEVVRTLLPIANALAAAHDRGVVHCDVKPDNILLVTDTANAVVPKLVDFGIAKFSRTGPIAPGSEAISGTPEYMSPEQVQGLDGLDGRTDVWSLSVVCYEALNGTRPFSGATLEAQLSAILVEQPAAPTHDSPELAAIIERGLAKDRADRWPSMRAFGQALADWALDNRIETDVTGTSLREQWPGEPARLSAPMPSAPPIAPAAGAELLAAAAATDAMARTEQVTISALEGSTSETTSPILLVVREPSALGLDPADDAEGALQPVAPKRRRLRGVASLVLLVAIGAVGARVVGRVRLAAAAAWLMPQAHSGASPGAAPTSAPEGSEHRVASTTGPEPTLAAPAPQTSAIAPELTGACILPILPATFDVKAPPDLGRICAETDPRRGAAEIRTELVRSGRGRSATQGMSEWAVLGWYELAAVEVVRGQCCPDASAVVLPPPTGSCGSLGTALDALRAAVRTGDDTDPPLALFRAAAHCELMSGVPSVYGYHRPLGGEEEALRKLLTRATGRGALVVPAAQRPPPPRRAVTRPVSSSSALTMPEPPDDEPYEPAPRP